MGRWLSWLCVPSPAGRFLPPGGFSRWVGCVLFSGVVGFVFLPWLVLPLLGLVWLPVVYVVVSSPLRGVAGVLVLSFVGSARWGHEH